MHIINDICAVCPNGCQLALELANDGTITPVSAGRCVRGSYFIGKTYLLHGGMLQQLEHPLSKAEIAYLVEQKRKKTEF